MDASHPSDFPRLLDILLANDYTLSKPTQVTQRTLFGGWSWWRKWRKGSDNEASSSEFYQSGSDELSMEAKATAPPKENEGHSKAYFDAIHSCLDGLMMEINAAAVHTVIPSHLLMIVHSLLYTHIVSVVSEGMLGSTLSAIQTYHSSQDSVASSSAVCPLEGDYLLVLTHTKFLLLRPLPMQKAKSTEPEKDRHEVPTYTTKSTDEMETVCNIVDALGVFTSCSEEDIEELDWVNCDSFRVDYELMLSDVQLLNILVNEEKGEEQLIHIKVNEETSLFLRVDYPIFVVNELMNRISHLCCCLCCTKPVPLFVPILHDQFMFDWSRLYRFIPKHRYTGEVEKVTA